MSTAAREFAVPVPPRVAKLPVHRGYPVPWFVAWIDGVPEFRVVGEGRLQDALETRRCWICGGAMGSFVAYVIGPMCSVNRTSAEPPSHRDCAEFAARACPFLTRPHMVRRTDGLPDGTVDAPGISLDRNPGVAGVWVQRGRIAARRVDHSLLFRLGDPTEVTWWRQARPATRGEVVASIEAGLPELLEVAKVDGPRAVAALDRAVSAAAKHLPEGAAA